MKNSWRLHEEFVLFLRMRNIHLNIQLEYGKENVKIVWQWEKIENKMVDFKNHRRFLLWCLSVDIFPVSIKLKSSIKTPKGYYYIIRKAERALLNERVKWINNTINMFMYQRDTCIDQLQEDQGRMWEIYQHEKGIQTHKDPRMSETYLKECARNIRWQQVATQTSITATMFKHQVWKPLILIPSPETPVITCRSGIIHVYL